jgi:hypothetical protein
MVSNNPTTFFDIAGLMPGAINRKKAGAGKMPSHFPLAKGKANSVIKEDRQLLLNAEHPPDSALSPLAASVTPSSSQRNTPFRSQGREKLFHLINLRSEQHIEMLASEQPHLDEDALRTLANGRNSRLIEAFGTLHTWTGKSYEQLINSGSKKIASTLQQLIRQGDKTVKPFAYFSEELKQDIHFYFGNKLPETRNENHNLDESVQPLLTESQSVPESRWGRLKNILLTLWQQIVDLFTPGVMRRDSYQRF